MAGVSTVSDVDTVLTPETEYLGTRDHGVAPSEQGVDSCKGDREEIMRVLVVEDFEVLARTIEMGIGWFWFCV